MAKRINGRIVEENAAPIVPLVQAGAIPVPLPPLSDLHADGMPGGSLHAPASEDAAGFMTAGHVKKLSQLLEEVGRLQVAIGNLTEDLAVMNEMADLLSDAAEEPDPKLAQAIDAATAAVSSAADLAGRVEQLELRPEVDPDQLAPRHHEHPPQPLPNHEHPEAARRHAELTEQLELQRAELEERRAESEAQRAEVDGLKEQLAFVRDMAERLNQSKALTPEHGYQGGGRTHAPVNDRLAGFATPEMVRRLDVLWGEREKG